MTCMFISPYYSLYMNICIYIYKCIYTYIKNVYMYINVYVYAYNQINTHKKDTYIYTYIYIYITSINTYKYIYIITFLHFVSLSLFTKYTCTFKPSYNKISKFSLFVPIRDVCFIFPCMKGYFLFTTYVKVYIICM
jgi:hypothetical protein